jgi:hypothetical protein
MPHSTDSQAAGFGMREFSFNDLKRLPNRTANSFAEHGVGGGDRVAWIGGLYDVLVGVRGFEPPAVVPVYSASIQAAIRTYW